MAKQRIDHSDEEWLRDRIRAASSVTTSPDFRQRVVRSVSEHSKASVRRIRRIATIALWSGIVVFGTAIVLVLSTLAGSSIVDLSLDPSAPLVTACGFVVAVVLGLATWEWLDGYV